MNSGARIKRLQNQDSNIRLLAAQREMYTCAKRVDIVHASVCLGIPLVFTLFQFVIPTPFIAILAVNGTAIITGLVLGEVTNKLVNRAARVQQAFDASVYGINFPNSHYDALTVSQYANRYKERFEEYSDLFDWYTVELSNKTPEEAVTACQRQNAGWSASLITRYVIFQFLLSAAVIALVIAPIYILGKDPSEFAFLLPIGEWLLRGVFAGLSKTLKERELNERLGHNDLSSEENIMITQDDIFRYRAQTFLVPDWFYKRFKDTDNQKTAGL